MNYVISLCLFDEQLEVLGQVRQPKAGGVGGDPAGDQLAHAAPTNDSRVVVSAVVAGSGGADSPAIGSQSASGRRATVTSRGGPGLTEHHRGLCVAWTLSRDDGFGARGVGGGGAGVAVGELSPVGGVDDHLAAHSRAWWVARQQHRGPIGAVDRQPPDLEVVEANADLDALPGPGDAPVGGPGGNRVGAPGEGDHGVAADPAQVGFR